MCAEQIHERKHAFVGVSIDVRVRSVVLCIYWWLTREHTHTEPSSLVLRTIKFTFKSDLNINYSFRGGIFLDDFFPFSDVNANRLFICLFCFHSGNRFIRMRHLFLFISTFFIGKMLHCTEIICLFYCCHVNWSISIIWFSFYQQRQQP